MYKPPDNLTFEDSSLTILYEENSSLNSTTSSLIIKGTRGGFLSLANACFFYLNDLQEMFVITDLPYINANLRLTIEQNETLNERRYGEVSQRGGNEFVWRMSESEICRVASEIHSLGYINNELHLDEAIDTTEITVYCVVL